MTARTGLMRKSEREQMYARILDLREKNLSFTEIADALGVSKGVVAGCVYRHAEKREVAQS